MNETIKEELNILLNNFWILKEDNMDLYYSIKRHQDEIRAFTSKNLGSKLIIHERFIKLEKIPSLANPNLGIPNFKNPMDYTFLCLVLLFLEDKTKDTYFMLSTLIDYVKNTSIALELNNIPNWTLSKDRRSVKRAIDFLLAINAIKLKDENNINFNEDENAEALYQTTGLSNYVMRMFTEEVFTYQTEEDFIKEEWTYQTEDKGDIRKYKVYRNLLYTPCIFHRDISESEIDYLKKMRGHMREELMNYLGLDLEVTRNMSFVYDYEANINKECFPNNKKISDIVLMVNEELLHLVNKKEIILDNFEIGTITYETLYQIIKDIKLNKTIYLSKQLKDLSIENFFLTITEYMEKYYFIKKKENEYEIYPTISRFVSKLIEKQENQLNIFGSEENV